MKIRSFHPKDEEEDEVGASASWVFLSIFLNYFDRSLYDASPRRVNFKVQRGPRIREKSGELGALWAMRLNPFVYIRVERESDPLDLFTLGVEKRFSTLANYFSFL